ncbi:MAG TPA: SDR family oxidoreductase [Bryobacteraceae bacterium]|nr:SDR family oxidoreductase [Bryobacteraceae bacterium]
MDLGIKDRVALVAASSSGLGKAVALGLAREGAKLALCSRNPPTLHQTAGEIRRDTGVEVLAVPVDVTDEEEVHSFVNGVLEQFGRIDICVTNAGGPPAKPFDSISVDEWRRAIDLNLMSTLFLAREVLPGMRDRGWGRLITITSLTVKQPVDGLILSNSVRAAVAGLVKSLSNEYAAHNVLVNNVCPGYTATDRLKDLSSALAEQSGATIEKIERQWTAQIPLGRLARPDEFADAVVFLASERASYITGQSILIDGGFAKGLL